MELLRVIESILTGHGYHIRSVDPIGGAYGFRDQNGLTRIITATPIPSINLSTVNIDICLSTPKIDQGDSGVLGCIGGLIDLAHPDSLTDLEKLIEHEIPTGCTTSP